MTKRYIAVLLGLIIGSGWFFYMSSQQGRDVTKQASTTQISTEDKLLPEIVPIEHASFIMLWGDVVIYNDPVGDRELYVSQPSPTLVLLSDIHGDHLAVDTLSAVVPEGVRIIAPAAVYEALTPELQTQTEILANDGVTQVAELTITALPMYNYPETEDSRHPKGRGNGYLLEKNGTRVYVAGDTAGIPEMKALRDIDIAFVPMNLPYTMSVEEAAEAVLAFAPRQVIPYHYRTPDGLSDVERFRELVTAGDSAIMVRLLPWYKAQSE